MAEHDVSTATPPTKWGRLNGKGANIDRSPLEVSRPSSSRAVCRAVQITEDYALQVGERFALGGHADIHRATMILSGGTECQVAVKVLRFHGTVASPASYGNSLTRIDKRLRRELEIWKRLTHPRITPLLAYVESSSKLLPGSGAALISPHRKNGNLLKYVSKKPSADKLLLLRQVCEGLEYIHTLTPPVVHLDLKPENILINDNEEAELCDFGLAKALEDVRTGFTTSTPGGTVIYMAPEALDGDCQTTECDMYAMGGVILHVMSGIPPWGQMLGQMRQIKVAAEVVQGKTPPRKEHTILGYDPPVVEAIWNLMHRCWSFKPPDRPKSWEVREALSDLQKRSLATSDNLAAGGSSLELRHREDIAFRFNGTAQSSLNSRNKATMDRGVELPAFKDFLKALRSELRPPIQPLAQPDVFLHGYASSSKLQYGSAQKPDGLLGPIEAFPRAIELQSPVEPQPATFQNEHTYTPQSQYNPPNYTGALVVPNVHSQEAFHFHPVVQLQLNEFRHGPSSTLEPQYNQAPNRDDLSATIEHYQEELDLRPPGHPLRHISLSDLASALKSRYDRDYNLADLSAAIRHYREALELRPPGHPSRGTSLISLGNALKFRYDQDYNPADLSAAIQYFREALDLRPPGHPFRRNSLSNLAWALQSRYDQDHDPAELSTAIQYNREALDLLPPGHPSRHVLLNNLATALKSRYNQDHDPADLPAAIQYNREALELRPPGHPSRDTSLNNLGDTLRSRYDRDHNPADLSVAIQYHQEALGLHPPGHPFRHFSLGLLAGALKSRFDRDHDPADLSTAIQYHQEALDLRPLGHPFRDLSLNNLGDALRCRYDEDHDPADLSAAIQCHRKALDLRPFGHPDRYISHYQLAYAFESRYDRDHNPADLSVAIQHFREALDLSSQRSAAQLNPRRPGTRSPISTQSR